MKIFQWAIYILKYTTVNYDTEYVTIHNDKGNSIIVPLAYLSKKSV